MIQRDAGTCQGSGRTRAAVHVLEWAIGCRTALTFDACGRDAAGSRWSLDGVDVVTRWADGG